MVIQQRFVWIVCLLIYIGNCDKDALEEGRTQYNLLEQRSTLPQYGSCWLAALNEVRTGCQHLDENVQSYVALQLADCFLVMSGQEPYGCYADHKPNVRAICVGTMSDRAFNVYTEFYTHTQNMCAFLMGQRWQSELMENTMRLNQQLLDSTERQRELLRMQQDTLRVQQEIIGSSQLLEQVLGRVWEQGEGHGRTIQMLGMSMAQFQGWITGRMAWLDSALFYGGCVATVLLSTALRQSRRARPLALLIVMLNALAEWIVHYVYFKYLSGGGPQHDSERVYGTLQSYCWLCRYLFVLLNVWHLVHHYWYYMDAELEQRQALARIERQNNALLELVHGWSAESTPQVRAVVVRRNTNSRCPTPELTHNTLGTSSVTYNLRRRGQAQKAITSE